MEEKLQKIYKNQKLPGLFDGDGLQKQSFDEHYVPSNMEAINEDNGERVTITRSKIFDPIADQSLQVLITGDPGAGKTTVFNEILNACGRGEEVAPGIFKAVKIKLKTLLDNKWEQPYGEKIQTEPLLCLIHYSLNKAIDKPRDRISFAEIEEGFADKDKIVLLFDGYEAVAHLAERAGIVRDVINVARDEFKYIAVASRSNVITEFMRNQFGRVIEVKGFSGNAARSYMTQYFIKQHESLKAVLDKFHDKTWQYVLSSLKHTRNPGEFEAFIQLTKIGSFMEIKDSQTYDKFIEIIDDYYYDTQQSLIKLLNNSLIREMVTNPTNAGMLCMVYSDPEVKMKLSHHFTLNELYHEVIALMGKRFKSKINLDGRFKDIDPEDALLVLKEIAYLAIKQDSLIKGDVIDDLIKKLISRSMTIEDLYKFGLLKTVDHTMNLAELNVEYETPRAVEIITPRMPDINDLIEQEHMFVQSSFKQYLAACRIAEKLQDELSYKEVVSFIAYNRNKPRYLNLFKIIAEILKATDNEIAIKRFYESIECNIEGVLELGIESKIILLMHLLGQARIGKEIDHRIANLEEAIKFIDNEILVNFIKWKDVIKESGYLSNDLEEALWKMLEKKPVQDRAISRFGLIGSTISSDILNNEDNLINEMKAAIEVAGSLLDKLDNKKLWNVLLNNLAQESNWQIQKASMNVMAKIIIDTKLDFLNNEGVSLSISPKSFIIIKFASYLMKPNLKEPAVNVLKAFIEAEKEDTKEVLDSLISLIDDKVRNDALYEIINQIISTADEEILDFALEKLIPTIKTLEPLSSSPIRRDASEKSEESIVSISALVIIKNAIINIRFANLALDKLLILLDQSEDPNIAFVVGEILAASEIEIQRSRFDQLMRNLHEESSRSLVILAINSVSRAGIKMKEEFSSKILLALQKIIEDPEIINKYEVIIAIEKVATIAVEIPNDIRQSVFASLTKIVTDFPIAYSAMAQIALNGNETIMEQVFDVFAPVLDSSFTQREVIIEPLNKLTLENISANLAARISEKLMQLLISGDNRVISTIANIAAKGYLSVNDFNQYIDQLVSLIGKETVIPAMHIISENNVEIRKILLIKLINALEQSTQDNIIKLIGEISDVAEVDEAEKLLTIYKDILVNKKYDGRVLAHSIGNISNKIGQEAINKFIMEDLLSAISSSSSENVISTAIYSIGKIVKQKQLDINIINLLLIKMTDIASNQEAIGKAACYTISKLVNQVNESNDLTDNLLKMATSFLLHGNRKNQYAIEIVGKLAARIYNKDHDELLDPILYKLKNLLQYKKYVEQLQLSMESVIRSMSFNSMVLLLKVRDQDVRQIAVKILIEKLPELQNTWEESIDNMLKIASSSIEKADLISNDSAELVDNSKKSSPNVKKIYDSARKIIQSQIKVMNENNLNWINDNFNRLIEVSKPETEAMMRGIFHNTLGDNEISEKESKFIVKYLTAFDATVTLSVDKKSNELILQFENGVYKLKGGTNQNYIEDIVNAVLCKTLDPLVRQHLDYIPIFTNTGIALEVSPIDVTDCISFLSKKPLTQWQVSFIYLSDHVKSYPENVFLLIEGRETGYYVAYKIYISSRSGAIKISHYKQHPNDLDANFRKEIFGEMQYDKTKVRYYSKTLDISALEAEELVEDAKSSLSSSARSFDFGHLVRSSAYSELESKSDEEIPIKPVFKKVNHFHLSDLVMGNLNFSGSPHSRAKPIKVKDIIKKIHDFLSKFIVLEDIKGDWEVDKLNFEVFGRELILSMNHQDSMNFDVASLITKDKLSDKAKEEVARIEADPYKNAFYLEIIKSLNAVYIASISIRSQMVANQQHGIMGGIGTLLSSVSSHIPFAGIAVDLMGQVLEGLDGVQQGKNIENYISFARDQVLMAEIVEKIARLLALKELTISEESFNISDSIDAVNTLISGGVKGAVVGMAVNAIDYLTTQEQDDPKMKQGESDAAAVVKLIIKNIFAGKYAKETHLNKVWHKAHMVASDIAISFGHSPIEMTAEEKKEIESALTEKKKKVLFEAEQDLLDNEAVSNLTLETKVDLPRDAALNNASIQQQAGCCSSCVIMTVMTDSDDPFTNNPEFQKILQLPKEERVTAYRKFNEPIKKNFFLTSEQGLDFLNKVMMRYGEDGLQQILYLANDEEAVEQILSEVEVRGIDPILDVFFEATLQTASNNFEKLVASEDGSLTGFYQYLNNAFANNIFTKAASHLLKTVNYLYEALEKALDKGEYGNKVAIIISLLGVLLEHAASGQGTILMPPPYYGPDDYGLDGPSGGGSGLSYNPYRVDSNDLKLHIYNGTSWNFTDSE